MSKDVYDVLDISRYIINKCNEKNYIISNLKLQKLLYFVQGFSMVLNKKKCFDDNIQAWDYGPVCPNAYHRFKKYGANNIPPVKQYEDIEFDGVDKIEWIKKEFKEESIDPNTRRLIDAVINTYAKYSASTLVDITHRQLPWVKTYNDPSNGKNAVIDDKLINDYFSRLVKSSLQ